MAESAGRKSVNNIISQTQPGKDSLIARYPWLERFKPGHSLLDNRIYRIAKRVMDLLLIVAAFPFWAPLMALCALLVKIESPRGTVFFKQERTGMAGQRFGMYKFRTMVKDAELQKQELAHLNELQWPDFKITNDPRTTHIGNILRKTSLDELPQIINVLKGEMSMVGPRPTSFSAETYALWQTERLDVIPGITGLWQLIGRGETEFDERLRMDIAYIERRCLWLDIQIFFRTFFAVIKRKGAF